MLFLERPWKTPELFSPSNDLLVSSFVEKIFDLGKPNLVPDLTDKPSVIEIGAWIVERPKEYKIWIIDPTWDLHNKRVEFRNPRARYLYFH
jgi:hypothetical protein